MKRLFGYFLSILVGVFLSFFEAMPSKLQAQSDEELAWCGLWFADRYSDPVSNVRVPQRVMSRQSCSEILYWQPTVNQILEYCLVHNTGYFGVYWKSFTSPNYLYSRSCGPFVQYIQNLYNGTNEFVKNSQTLRRCNPVASVNNGSLCYYIPYGLGQCFNSGFNTVPSGAYTQLTCNANMGASLNGEATATCKDGVWSNSLGSCPQCPAVNRTNGTLVSSIQAGKPQLTLNCDSGYILKGSSVATCSAGSWSDLGSCVKTCNNQPTSDSFTLRNGSFTYANQVNGQNLVGTTATLTSCPSNYVVNPSVTNVALCQSDGTWSSPVASCIVERRQCVLNMQYATDPNATDTSVVIDLPRARVLPPVSITDGQQVVLANCSKSSANTQSFCNLPNVKYTLCWINGETWYYTQGNLGQYGYGFLRYTGNFKIFWGTQDTGTTLSLTDCNITPAGLNPNRVPNERGLINTTNFSECSSK